MTSGTFQNLPIDKVTQTFVWYEDIADFAYRLNELIERSGSDPSEMSFQLGNAFGFV